MEHQADVIIVGTGVAGLFCALQLPKRIIYFNDNKGQSRTQ